MSQTVFITGASSGIGKATARHFAAQGWNVVATMRSPEDGAELTGDRVLVTRLDLLQSDSIHSSVTEALERFGAIDVLVNNAGYGAYGPLEATPMSVLRRQFDVNFFGTIAITKSYLPLLGAVKNYTKKPGKILNISSVSGQIAYPFMSPYCASKFALEAFSDSLRRELLLYGIDVIVIEPGPIKTPIWNISSP